MAFDYISQGPPTSNVLPAGGHAASCLDVINGLVYFRDYTDANGEVGWLPTGSPVAAPVGSIQFNNNGSLGGSSALTWDNVNNILTITDGVAGGEVLQNTLPATVSVSQASPVLTIAGTYWNGAASAVEQWTIQSVPITAGANGQYQLRILHTGSTNSATNNNGVAIGNLSGGQPGHLVLLGTDGSTPACVFSGQGTNSGNITATDFTFNLGSSRRFIVNITNAIAGGTGTVEVTNGAAATSGTSQPSPTLQLNGTFWNGAASALDQWTIQNTIANGTNGRSTLAFTHSGSPASAQNRATFNTGSFTTTISQDGNGSFIQLSTIYSQGGSPVIFSQNGTGNICICNGAPTNMNSLFNVKGNAAIGLVFGTNSTVAAPANGLIVQGKVGIGTATPITGDLQIAQITNGDDALNIVRNTDTAPTGNFLNFTNAAVASLFIVDIAGNVTQVNPVAATSGTSQSSPTHALNGTYWTGAASATDQWTIQDVVGNGTNGSSTLTIGHSGSAGGSSAPLQVLVNVTGTANGNTRNPALAVGSAVSGLFGNSSGIGFVMGGSNSMWFMMASTGTQFPTSGVLGWSSSATLQAAGNDTGISRLAAASLAFGNGAGGDFTAAIKFGNATLTSAAPTVAAAQVGLGSTTAATATAGAAALPAAPAGFLVINVAGTTQKIPYYNA